MNESKGTEKNHGGRGGKIFDRSNLKGKTLRKEGE